MHFSIFTVFAAGTSTVMAATVNNARDVIGTFDTFTNADCSEGGTGITVTGKPGYTPLAADVVAINSHLPAPCYLVIWSFGGPPVVIHPGLTDQCIPLEESNIFWNVIC